MTIFGHNYEINSSKYSTVFSPQCQFWTIRFEASRVKLDDWSYSFVTILWSRILTIGKWPYIEPASCNRRPIFNEPASNIQRNHRCSPSLFSQTILSWLWSERAVPGAEGGTQPGLRKQDSAHIMCILWQLVGVIWSYIQEITPTNCHKIQDSWRYNAN